METAIGTFQADNQADFTPTLGEIKPIDIVSLKRRKIKKKTVANLEKAVARDGSFLHPPAVRDEGEGRYLLIHGHHRLEAWKRCRGEQTPIRANIYPLHTPDALIELFETEENLFRKELTAVERTAQEMRWVAALKELNGEEPVTPVSGSGEAAETGNLIPSLPPARGGRGNKGMALQVADKFGIRKRTVNLRRNSAAAVIGEEIDFDCDTPEELERKAAELERAGKRLHTEPKAKRPKHRERAPQEVVNDSGEIDSEIEEVWRAFTALSERKQLKIMLRACQLRGWALKLGRARRVPAVDEESALTGDLPVEVAPASDDTVAVQAEDGDEVAVAHAEEEDDAAVAQANQGDNGAEFGAKDLQDAGDDVPEAADQEIGVTKCAYCKDPFSSSDPPEMKYGRLYHADLCVKYAKPIAIAA
jgi:hypothetical protein